MQGKSPRAYVRAIYRTLTGYKGGVVVSSGENWLLHTEWTGQLVIPVLSNSCQLGVILTLGGQSILDYKHSVVLERI